MRINVALGDFDRRAVGDPDRCASKIHSQVTFSRGVYTTLNFVSSPYLLEQNENRPRVASDRTGPRRAGGTREMNGNQRGKRVSKQDHIREMRRRVEPGLVRAANQETRSALRKADTELSVHREARAAMERGELNASQVRLLVPLDRTIKDDFIHRCSMVALEPKNKAGGAEPSSAQVFEAAAQELAEHYNYEKHPHPDEDKWIKEAVAEIQRRRRFWADQVERLNPLVPGSAQ